MNGKNIGKTNIKGKLPTYDEYCDVSAQGGLDEMACTIISARMREKKVEPGKIIVCRIDTGAEADVTNVLALVDLHAQFGTRLLVFTHDAGLQPTIDEVAEIISTVGNNGPLI